MTTVPVGCLHLMPHLIGFCVCMTSLLTFAYLPAFRQAFLKQVQDRFIALWSYTGHLMMLHIITLVAAVKNACS